MPQSENLIVNSDRQIQQIQIFSIAGLGAIKIKFGATFYYNVYKRADNENISNHFKRSQVKFFKMNDCRYF